MNLGYNRLQHLDILLETLSKLQRLQYIILRGNPLASTPDYRRHVLFQLSTAVELDGISWTSIEVQSMIHSRKQTSQRRSLPSYRLVYRPMQRRVELNQQDFKQL